jgi:Tfp pilus assembly protein PilV
MALTRARPPRLRGECGLTIIETLFAIVLLAVAFLGMAGVQAISSKAQTLGKNQGLATYVANQELERARLTRFSQIETGTPPATTLEGVTFNTQRTVAAVGSNKRVEVVTTWTDRFGPRQVRLATVVSEVTNP